MLSRLLKYDLKAIFKEMLIPFLLIFADALLYWLSSNIDYLGESSFMDTVRSMLQGLLMVFGIIIVVSSLKLSWKRMSSNMYGAESYLTRTLPVSTQKVFLAKVLAGMLCVLAGFAVVVLAVTIAFPDVWELAGELADMFQMSTPLMLLIAVMIVVSETFFILMAGFLGTTIGHLFHDNHYLWSTVATIAIYIIGSLLLIAIEMLLGSLFDRNIIRFFFGTRFDSLENYTYDPISAVRSFILIATTVYIIYDVACVAVGSLIQKRGADID